jgi:hypothetical protein
MVLDPLHSSISPSLASYPLASSFHLAWMNQEWHFCHCLSFLPINLGIFGRRWVICHRLLEILSDMNWDIVKGIALLQTKRARRHFREKRHQLEFLNSQRWQFRNTTIFKATYIKKLSAPNILNLKYSTKPKFYINEIWEKEIIKMVLCFYSEDAVASW